MGENYHEIAGETVNIDGLTDAHGHIGLLGDQRAAVDLSACGSAAAMWPCVARAAREQPDGWLIGFGWDEQRWPDARWPDGRMLEQMLPGRPVLLYRIDTHAAVASPAALRLAGLTRDTPGCAGGTIIRADDGELTGGLIDAPLLRVLAQQPAPSVAERRRRCLDALHHLAAHGYAAVHDMRVTTPLLETLLALARDNLLPLHVVAALDATDPAYPDWLARGPFCVGRLAIGAVKWFADGALGSRGAALVHEYADQPGVHGHLLYESGALTAQIRTAMAAGFQPVIHAIGSAANRQVLDCFQTVRADDPARFTQLRPRIEHAQILADSDLPRFAALGVVASVQLIHAMQDAHMAALRLGAHLAAAYRYAALAQTGCVLAGGSDFPIAPVDPAANFRAALACGLTWAQARHAWTRGAHFAGHHDRWWPTVFPAR